MYERVFIWYTIFHTYSTWYKKKYKISESYLTQVYSLKNFRFKFLKKFLHIHTPVLIQIPWQLTWYSVPSTLPIHTFPGVGEVRSTTTPSVQVFSSGKTCVHSSNLISVYSVWMQIVYLWPWINSPGSNLKFTNSCPKKTSHVINLFLSLFPFSLSLWNIW